MRVWRIAGIGKGSVKLGEYFSGGLFGGTQNFPTFSPRLGYSLAFLRLGHQVVRGWTEPGISPSSALPLHGLTETFMTGHDLGACSTNGRLAGNRYRCCAAYLTDGLQLVTIQQASESGCCFHSTDKLPLGLCYLIFWLYRDRIGIAAVLEHESDSEMHALCAGEL